MNDWLTMRLAISPALFCVWCAVSLAVSDAPVPPTKARFTLFMPCSRSSDRRLVPSCASRLASLLLEDMADSGKEREESVEN